MKRKPLPTHKSVTFYISCEAINNLQSIAEKFHKQGVPGLLDVDGKVNRSPLINYLINKENPHVQNK